VVGHSAVQHREERDCFDLLLETQTESVGWQRDSGAARRGEIKLPRASGHVIKRLVHLHIQHLRMSYAI
jgi:hypothetical protein